MGLQNLGREGLLMKRLSILFLLLFMSGIITMPAEAQRPRKTPSVQRTQNTEPPSISMVITDRQSAATSSPNNLLYTVSLRFTNNGSSPVQFTNNNIALLDNSGRKYFVSRLKFAETVIISAGGSAECSRVFFEVPRDAKVSEAILLLQGKIVARTKF